MGNHSVRPWMTLRRMVSVRVTILNVPSCLYLADVM
jgi:hypothetical protein